MKASPERTKVFLTNGCSEYAGLAKVRETTDINQQIAGYGSLINIFTHTT
ncbi:hypothetical protein [Nostoc sp. CHAB 5715]|nr:hypothetical protein [Nostoc sp. CHAB 5715]